MSTLAFPGRWAGADGVRPRITSPRKARREARKRPVSIPAKRWPDWTDGQRYGVLNPRLWPSWTSEVRITLGDKGRRPMQTTYAALPALERLILSGLRAHRTPVDAGHIPRVCGLDPDRQFSERREALKRLMDLGLIASKEIKKLNPARPLLDPIPVTIYWATGGDS